MFRHLPPTATPLPPAVVAAAILAGPGAVARFEADFTQVAGVDASVSAASGRTALYLFLHALRSENQGRGRTRVVMPGYTCPSLARVTLDAGLEPLFVDIDPTSMAYDLEALASAVDERVLVVICVHPFGQVHAVAPVARIAHNAGAVVLEDAAQSMGAALGERWVGTCSDYGLFSLGPGKPLSAGGGGVLTINHGSRGDHILAARAELGALSITASPLALLRLAAFTAAFHPHGWWLVTRIGAHKAGDDEAHGGFRMHGLSPAQAAVARHQLPHLAAYNQARRRTADALIDQIAVHGWAAVPQDVAAGSDTHPIHLRLPIIVDSEPRAQELYAQLWARGIGVGRMYKRSMDQLFPSHAGRTLTGSRQVAARLLTLPTHHYVNKRDREVIVEGFAQVAGERSEASLQVA